MNAIALCYTTILLVVIYVNWHELKADYKRFDRWCEYNGLTGWIVNAAFWLYMLTAMLPWYWL